MYFNKIKPNSRPIKIRGCGLICGLAFEQLFAQMLLSVWHKYDDFLAVADQVRASAISKHV